MRGGMKIFGPVPRSFDYTLPKKVRAFGLKIALTTKLEQGKVILR